MAAKRNRWLILSVLILALAAFLSISLLPLFSSLGERRLAANTPSPTGSPTDAQAELAARAKGYELVLEREPENQAALRGLVEARLQMGDLPGVMDPLEKLADLNPEMPDYRVLLGQTRQQMGDLEGAAQAYRTVLDQQAGNMNALQGLVALLVQQGRPQAAVGLLQDTLKTAEQLSLEGDASIDQTSVKLLLAQVYVEDNGLEKALTLYDEAIQAAPEDFRPVLAKALVLQQAERQEEAQPLFDQALAMAPAQYKDEIERMSTEGAASPESAPLEEAPLEEAPSKAPDPAPDAENLPVPSEAGE